MMRKLSTFTPVVLPRFVYAPRNVGRAQRGNL
jgi:hypothetical protein